MINRRKLMTSAAFGAAALAMAGCATDPGTGTVSVWAAGIQSIATTVAAVLPQVEGAVNIPAATLSAITNALSGIQSAASTISAASTSLSGSSVLAQIEGYVNALAPLILPYISIIPGGQYISLIVAALPAIEVALNFISSLTAQALSVATAATPAASSARLRGPGAVALTPAVSQLYLNKLIAHARALR